MYYVYSLNFTNGKAYVGITKNINQRLSQHLHQAKIGDTKPLYNAIRKHGREGFMHEVLLKGITLEQAVEVEKQLIKECKKEIELYNISEGGYVPVPNQSEITKRMMQDPIFRARALNSLQTVEARAKRKASLNTPEHKKYRSELNKKRFREGYLDKKSKTIQCVETGVIYASTGIAARAVMGRREHLKRHLKGHAKSYKGFHFIYV